MRQAKSHGRLATLVAVGAAFTGACGGLPGDEPVVVGPAPRAIVATPRAIDGDLRFTTLAVGLHHACGLDATGAAWCWGSNEYGQLGTSVALPRCDGGSVACSPAPVRVDTALRFVAISASLRHTCALEASGAAWCWGFGVGGQLGDGLSTSSVVPVRVAGTASFVAIELGGSGLVACALERSGAGHCWGPGGGAGALGDGTNGGSNAPVPVASQAAFASLAVGDDHACAVAGTGAAYCWGRNAFGKLGLGVPGASTVPAAVSGGLAFSRLGAGLSHTCGLALDGRAWCWGAAAAVGSAATGSVLAPLEVAGGRAYRELGAGANHTCALDANGTAWCWGENLEGQLGDGTTTGRVAPVAVTGAPAFTSVRAGTATCALDAAGRAWCWGVNTFGQAGTAP